MGGCRIDLADNPADGVGHQKPLRQLIQHGAETLLLCRAPRAHLRGHIDDRLEQVLNMALFVAQDIQRPVPVGQRALRSEDRHRLDVLSLSTLGNASKNIRHIGGLYLNMQLGNAVPNSLPMLPTRLYKGVKVGEKARVCCQKTPVLCVVDCRAHRHVLQDDISIQLFSDLHSLLTCYPSPDTYKGHHDSYTSWPAHLY